MKEYTRRKHNLICVTVAAIVGFLLYGLPLVIPRIQGIIGGADGPTVTYMTATAIIGPEWMSEWMMYLTVAIINPVTIVFVIALFLYKPVKKRVEDR